MLPANDTPFLLERFAIFDKTGAETLVVLLKGTFEIANRQPAVVAKEQSPVVPADVYVGEPGVSSVRTEGDYSPPKPSTGVTVTGSAVASEPGLEPVTVGIRIGELSQTAVVYGNRCWDRVLGFSRITPAEPFQDMPLTWENAFGGVDQSSESQKHWEFQPDNPVGKGLLARKTAKPLAGTALPNIERADQCVRNPGDRPVPIGFAPIAPNWRPRASFAGTYDEKWREERAPLLPEDFDPRYYQTAPVALSAGNYFVGGETCVVVGMTSTPRLEFDLPKITPRFRLCWPTGTMSIEPRLDTIHLDTNQMRLHVLWRGVQQVHGRLESLQRIEASFDRKGAM